MPRIRDLTGMRFGRLAVISYAGLDEKKLHAKWLCRCDCGKNKVVRGHNLTQGTVVSCGCYAIENNRRKSITHGMTHTRLYRIWRGMRTRCECVNTANYQGYGARGIKVCEEWKKDFSVFRDWAVSRGYNDDLSIDRIDVNGDYKPDNCRWATVSEQARNRRTNVNFAIGGINKTLAEWCRIYGIRQCTVSARLKKGYGIELALAAKSLPAKRPEIQDTS